MNAPQHVNVEAAWARAEANKATVALRAALEAALEDFAMQAEDRGQLQAANAYRRAAALAGGFVHRRPAERPALPARRTVRHVGETG